MNRAGHQRTLPRRDEPSRHTERDLVQGAPLSPNVTTSLRRLEPAVARLGRARIRITDRHRRSRSGNAAQATATTRGSFGTHGRAAVRSPSVTDAFVTL